MVILDLSMVIVALPSIRSSLAFSPGELQWVINAYVMTFAGFLLLGRRAVQRLGERPVFVGALCVFSIASLTGGAAVSREMLVVARGVQGFSSAFMAASSLAIVTSSLPSGRRVHQAVALWAAMSGAAAAGGVLIGGIITEELSWRWVLLINPPIGVAAAIVGWVVLARRSRAREPRAPGAYDIAGAVTLTLGLLGLVYGVSQAGERGWQATIALGPIIAGLSLLALFCVVETKVASDPLVPFKDFRRPLRATNIIVAISSAALFPAWYLSSLYLQQVLWLSPIRVGVTFLPMALTVMLVAPATGRLVGRVGVRGVLAGGLSIMAVGLLLFTRVAAGSSAVIYALVPGVLTAAGIGISIVASTIAAIQGASRRQAGLAWGLVNTSRQIGAGLGIAVLTTVAAALTGHLIGHGRELPQALTEGFRLGYWIAAGLAAAAAVAALTLLPKAAERAIPGMRLAQITVGFGLVLGCFVGAEVAVGGSHASPVGAYTRRGAYRFVSAPGLHPPIVRAATRPTHHGQLAKGYVFMANFYNPGYPPMVGQSGPLILDQRLSPVWFKPVPENKLAGNLSLQSYDGRPVLAWWQGNITTSGWTKSGEYVVVNRHYRSVARLRGADGWVLTLHDIVIRGEDAWVTASKNVPMNLSRYGGANNGAVIDSAVQEYNLRTGRLVRSWDALAHIPLSDSWAPVPTNGAFWDAYHLNSIDLPGDGSFVVSMRNTWAAYKVKIATGRIEWTLGGKHSSFKFGPGAAFQWQHDVRVYPGTLRVTLFDDHCCQTTAAGARVPATRPSRGLVLNLSSTTHTATLVDQYTHGTGLDTEYMGNIELLHGGNVLVGWGSQPQFSEYTASGKTLLDAVLPGSDYNYRATIEPWVGLPLDPPVGAVRRSHSRTVVYASWNGATEVTSWRVLGGASDHSVVVVGSTPRTGFETPITVPPSYSQFRVQALGARGRLLGTSKPFELG